MFRGQRRGLFANLCKGVRELATSAAGKRTATKEGKEGNEFTARQHENLFLFLRKDHANRAMCSPSRWLSFYRRSLSRVICSEDRPTFRDAEIFIAPGRPLGRRHFASRYLAALTLRKQPGYIS